MRKSTPADQARAKIGALIRRERGDRTQEDVEREHGIPQSVMSRVERGEYRALNVDLLLRICLALNCPPTRLLDGIDELYIIAKYEATAA